MSELQQWINSYLIKWGLVHDSANIWDNLVVLLLLIVITVGIDYTCRYTSSILSGCISLIISSVKH